MTIAGPLVAAVRDDRVPGVSGDTGIEEDASTALLAAIVRYARALGRVVVALDVRDAGHARRLRDLGCDFATGPAFGPAMPPEQIEMFMSRHG